jgi:hypothetical protein
MPEEQPCPQKTQLFDAYQRALLEYVRSLTDFEREMGRMPKYQYDRLHSRLEFLKAVADKTKANYDSHIREYGC